MAHTHIQLGEELTGQVGKAIKEYKYQSKTSFVRDAIRHRLRELNSERKVVDAWHALLSVNSRERMHEGRIVLRGEKQNHTYHAQHVLNLARIHIQDLLKRGSHGEVYKE